MNLVKGKGKKTMLYDKDIRDSLCLFMEEAFGKVRFFDEFRIGSSRADLVMVSKDSLIGIEIKSNADSYARLPTQVRDYDRFFDGNYIAIGASHAAHVSEHIPEHWGIIVVNEQKDSLSFRVLRNLKPTQKSKLHMQIKLLWRRELAHIQAKNGLYRYAGKSRLFVERYILRTVEKEKLKACMIEELFERDYTVFEKR